MQRLFNWHGFFEPCAVKWRFIYHYIVTCVQNMVGPGEVDDELESETAEECGKYGKVVKCLIFEVSLIFST